MNWKSYIKVKPTFEPFEKRIRSGFLWCPKYTYTIENEVMTRNWRWLETATWEQEYLYHSERWIDIGWID